MLQWITLKFYQQQEHNNKTMLFIDVMCVGTKRIFEIGINLAHLHVAQFWICKQMRWNKQCLKAELFFIQYDIKWG